MKRISRHRHAPWTAIAVITAAGAVAWAVLCAADLAHGDALRSLVHGVLAALAVYGTAHAVGKRRSWRGARR